MGCHFLLQGIFLTQESNPGLLHCRQMIYQLSYERIAVNFSRPRNWKQLYSGANSLDHPLKNYRVDQWFFNYGVWSIALRIISWTTENLCFPWVRMKLQITRMWGLKMITISAVTGNPNYRVDHHNSTALERCITLACLAGFWSCLCAYLWFLSPIDSCVSFLLLLQYITTDFMAWNSIIYYLMVQVQLLEVWVKSRCHYGKFLCGGSREESVSLFFPAFRGHLLSFAYGFFPPFSKPAASGWGLLVLPSFWFSPVSLFHWDTWQFHWALMDNLGYCPWFQVSWLAIVIPLYHGRQHIHKSCECDHGHLWGSHYSAYPSPQYLYLEKCVVFFTSRNGIWKFDKNMFKCNIWPLHPH